jgi:hypothetical protein
MARTPAKKVPAKKVVSCVKVPAQKPLLAKMHAKKATSCVKKPAKKVPAKKVPAKKRPCGVTMPAKMVIKISLPTGQQINLDDVSPSDDVKSVQAKIQHIFKFGFQFSLCIFGTTLLSGTLREHGVQHGMVLTLVVNGKFVIKINDSRPGQLHRQLTLLVSGTTTIADVKNMLVDETGISRFRYLLYGLCDDESFELRDQDTMRSLHLKDGDVLDFGVADRIPTRSYPWSPHLARSP